MRFGKTAPMSALYADAPVTVRSDLDTAHADTLASWSRPGNAWTGAQRLAIVAEVRAARAAEPTPPPWAPVAADRRRAMAQALPDIAVDVTWRLTNHPGTLTADWYDSVIAADLSPLRYVELVSLVASACSLDVFAEAIGADARALPGPVDGEPDHRALDAAVDTHWVPTAVSTGAVGAMVTRSLTLSPVATETWARLSNAQYVPPDALLGDLSYTRGALDRSQVEFLAARTSLRNECFY